jgi:predicted RNA-binding protein with PIN domain
MPILIDGHNLIGRMATISLADHDDEEKLIRMLISYRARTGKRLTVVFDPGSAYASPETRRWGGLEIVYVSRGSNADRVIERRVRGSRNPQEWLVVTSDLELAERVAQMGARVRSAEDFAAELSGPSDIADDERGDATPSPMEVEEWLAIFGDGEGASSSQEAGNDFLAIFGESE